MRALDYTKQKFFFELKSNPNVTEINPVRYYYGNKTVYVGFEFKAKNRKWEFKVSNEGAYEYHLISESPTYIIFSEKNLKTLKVLFLRYLEMEVESNFLKIE